MALLAGVMKLKTSDPQIKNAFEIAKERHIQYKFIPKNLGEKYHPNTVEVVLEDGKNKMSVIGSSIGGGMIEIVKIDEFDVYLQGSAGRYLSLVICHEKTPKILAELIKKINKLGIKIAETVQSHFKDERLTVLSLEGRRITLPEVMELEMTTEGVDFIRSLSKLQQQ
jgi:L-serine dehydratase